MINLQSLSARDRKFLYYGLPIAALILVYLFIAEPLWFSYRGYREKIPQLAGMVQRYSELVETADLRKSRKKSYESRLRQIVKSSFIAETEALATGQLAQLVREKARKTGITLKSSKPEKPEAAGKMQLLNLSVTFDSSLSKLANFLKELQNDRWEILVREAKIVSQKQKYADSEPERLSVKLLITGLRFFPSSAPNA